jgi:glycosyltransferase involved in cell wall biosynthesis
MRILQVTLDLSPDSTGVLVTVAAFNHAFVELGHSTTILSFDRRAYTPPERPLTITSVQAINIPFTKRYGLSLRAALGEWDDAVRSCDAVFIHSMYAHHFAWAAKRALRFGKHCYIVPHGSLTDFCLSRRTRIKRLWLAAMQPYIGTSTALLSSAYERDQALHHIRPAHTAVLYWPVKEAPEPADCIGETTGRKVALLVGRLHPMKRTLETVRSFRRTDTGDWQLCLAGPPTPEVSIGDLQREAGAEWQHRIRYLCNLDRAELEAWYRRAHCLLLFSRGDNFSHVTADALLAGCPAYVSQDVGLGSLIEKHNCGKVSLIRNQADLDSAVTLALSDATRGGRQRAHQVSHFVRSELSFSSFKRRIAEVLQAQSECAEVTVSNGHA